jgi:hypothetical protein
MSTMLTRTPPPIAFTKKPIYVELESDNINPALPNPYLQPNLSAYMTVFEHRKAQNIGAPFNFPYNSQSRRGLININSAFSYVEPELPYDEALEEDSDFTFQQGGVDSFAEYELKFAEKYGIPPVVQALSNSPKMLAFSGWGNVSDLDSTTKAYIFRKKNAQYRKITTDMQPEFLTLMPKFDYDQPAIFVEITVWFEDGTSALKIVNTDRYSLFKHRLYVFRTGLRVNGLHKIQPTKRIASYNYRVMIDNLAVYGANSSVPPEVLAEARYQLDKQTTEHDMYLLADNGYGGVESLLLRGRIKEKEAAEFTTINNPEWQQSNAREGLRSDINSEPLRSYELEDMLMRRAVAENYRNLLFNGRLWWMDLKNNRFVRVTRLTKEIIIDKRKPFVFFNFSFQLAWRQS